MRKIVLFQFIGLTMAMALVGCGGKAYEDTTVTANPPADDPADPQGLVQPTLQTGSSLNFLPAISTNFTFSGTGSSTTPPVSIQNIDTDNLLKVKITPQAAPPVSIPGFYSNYSANYGCMKFSVRIKHSGAPNGYTVSTPNMLLSSSPAQGCAGQPNNSIVDLSGNLTSGHGAVTVEVFGARYDVYCSYLVNWMIPGLAPWDPWGQSNYCSSNLYPVYATHTVTGLLEIQTNGTAFGG